MLVKHDRAPMIEQKIFRDKQPYPYTQTYGPLMSFHQTKGKI